jgi:hypothetical protein
MRTIKTIATALVAAGALNALITASASAGWFVGGTELKTSAAIATTAVVDEKIKFLAPAVIDLTIECAGSTLDSENGKIEGTDKSFASKLTFLACSTVKPATGCAIESQPVGISTNPILALAALKSGEEDKVTFTPETGKVFAEIAFSSADTCAFNGLEGVKGAFTLGVPTGQLELESQALVGLGSLENNSLEVANSKAYVVGGKSLLRLASGSKWSFH